MGRFTISKRQRKDRGFTLVEVAIVAPLMMLVILGLFGLLTYLVRTSASEQTASQSLYEEHSALEMIRSDAALSSKFLPQNDTNLPDPATGSAWNYTGASGSVRTLILRSYATSGNPQSVDRRAVFLKAKGCATEQLYYNTPLTFNTVYFVNNGNLYRRLLVDTSQDTCSDPYQKQTCPSRKEAPGSWKCMADDEVVATGVTTFNVDYYTTSDDDDILDAYTGTNGAQMVTNADSVRVTIGITRRAYGIDQTNTTSLRMSKLITGQTDNS